MDQKQSINPQSLVLWMIWGALSFANISYVAVLQLSEREEVEAQSSDTLVKVLAMVGILLIVAGFLVRKKLTEPAAKKSDSVNLAAVMPSTIASWAFADAVAIFGLALGMMGYPTATYGSFLVAGFGAMVFLAPTFAPIKS